MSLLDIHVEPATSVGPTDSRRLEILEAGTGHGSLTLHLARSIHAANPPGEPRNAIIHTLDNNEHRSNFAKKIVQGFARSIYSRDVDFHVGEIPGFLEQQYEQRRSSDPFLSAAVLDLPGAEEFLTKVCNATHTDGLIAVYCPNVTQIAESAMMVKKLSLPLKLMQTVELGPNLSGGKQWEVFPVMPRKAFKRTASTSPLPPDDSEPEQLSSQRKCADEAEKTVDEKELEVKMVCRPRHGMFIHVGGFVGVWRKSK